MLLLLQFLQLLLSEQLERNGMHGRRLRSAILLRAEKFKEYFEEVQTQRFDVKEKYT